MNRKHSFLTRCLAMLLVLVLVASNVNFTAFAAETSESLLTLVAQSTDCGTAELRAVLAHAAALKNLKDEDVSYETAPEAVSATLRQNVLSAPAHGQWVPYTWATLTDSGEIKGDVTFATETTDVKVTYRNEIADAAEQLAYIAALADEAGEVHGIFDTLINVEDGVVVTALYALDAYLVDEELTPAIEGLTALDLLGEEKMNELYVDIDENGTIEEWEKELALPEIEKAVDEEKAKFMDTIALLKERQDASKGGRPYLYGMLVNYSKQGLPYYYANAETLINEMVAMSDCLNTVATANPDALTALFEAFPQFKQHLSVENLTKLADYMSEAAITLTDPANPLDLFKTEIDTTYADLAGLCDALAAAGGAADYNTKVYRYAEYTVLDDSWKYIQVDCNGDGVADVNIKVATGEPIDMDSAVTLITDAYLYYDVDLTELYALEGKAIEQNDTISCPATAIEYPVEIKDQDGKVVDTQMVTIEDCTIVLPCEEGHEMTYAIYGNPVTITEPMKIMLSITDAANGKVDILLIEDFDIYKDDLETLVRKLNEKLGAGSVTLVGEDGAYTGLVANIDMGDMNDFGMTIYESGYESIKLNYKPFFYKEDGMYQISIQAMIEALLNDETFTSDKLIALGEGRTNNLLNTTLQIPGYDLFFSLNLKSVPEQMTTVSKGLNAIKNYMTFGTNKGELTVNVNLPEKVYEAYLAAALAAGRIDDDNVQALNHEVALLFAADVFEVYMNSDATTATYENTLALIGKEVDLSEYEKYHAAVKKVATSDGFQYAIGEQYVEGSLTGTTDNLEAALALFGINMRDLTMGLDIVADETLHAKAVVKITNEVPDFQAAVIEPGKLNDAGYRAKLSAADFTTNVVSRLNAATGHVVVVLLDDVNGDLNFPKSAILDLNGNTVNGNVTANGTLIIVDSALDTYNGGAVTGTVTAAKGAITGGTYGSDVSAFLKDGYYQDNGSVRNTLYYIKNNGGNVNYVLNANFYEGCEGYLPSVKALAVDIAADVAMSYYPAAALAYDGNTIFSLNFDAILTSYLGNGKDGAIDALITDLCGMVYADGINALANDIIDDLCDFAALAEAMENGTALCSYSFSANVPTVEFVYVEDQDCFDISFTASKTGKSFGLALTVEGDNKYYNYTKELLAAMAEIVIVDAGVEVEQPTYDAAGNELYIGGGAYAHVTFDFSVDSDYTKGLAIILAYGNPDKAEALMAAMPCVVDVNEVIAKMTVEEVFTALKVMSRDVDMAAMAEAVGYAYTVDEIADMEKVYHVILCGIGAGLEKLDITGNSNTLDTYLTGDNTYSYDKTYDRAGDVTVKGYTGVFEVTELAASVTIKLAPKCTKIIGDVNSDGKVDIFDAALLQRYCTKLATEDELHLCVADVNDDGVIDIFDAAMIQRYCTNLIDSFPAEAK